MRNVSPVKINEFRISSPNNPTDSFIELYNSGGREVDISTWTLTQHAVQQAIFSAVKIPPGTKLAARGFYLLGLSNPNAETRKILSIGTPAANPTRLWQPLPDGPVMTIPAGSANVPVTNAAGFVVGEKIALGYGAVYPAVARTIERYEVATVTAVGKPGTQAWLGADAAAGATNIKVRRSRTSRPATRSG